MAVKEKAPPVQVWVIPDASKRGQRETLLEIDVEAGRLKGKPPIPIYKKMQKDPGVSYPLHLLRLALAKSRLAYLNPDKDIKKFVDENLEELSYTILRDAFAALAYGFAPFERRFVMKDGLYFYKEFIALDPEYITIKIHPELKGFDGIVQEPPFFGQKVELPVVKSFVFTHNLEFSNLYGVAQIDSAYVPWIIDREFWRFHGVALQEFGLPTLVGRAPEGSRQVQIHGETKDIRNTDLIKFIGESVRSESVVVIPAEEGWSLDVLFEKRAIIWDFNKDHDFLNLQKALAILIPPEIYREGGGAYAKARIQSFWFEQTVGSILEALLKHVIRYLIKPLIRLNFYDGRVEPPYGKLQGEPMTLSFKDVGEALIKASGEKRPEIDWRALLTLMRIPLVPEGEEPEVKALSFEEIPQNLRVIEELCRKFYNKGIELGKEELAYAGFVPLGKEDHAMLESEAKRLQWLLKRSENPRPVFGSILGRLRAEGREKAVNFFYSQVDEGRYVSLTKPGGLQ
jgi:hypothetical protein